MRRPENCEPAEPGRQQREPGDRQVDGNDVADRGTDVVVDAPAGADRGDDACDVVVDEHERGGLARARCQGDRR